jgi:hypothetical protein
MIYIKLAPLPETEFPGIAIYPEDKTEEIYLKAEIEKMKIEQIRNFIRSKIIKIKIE